jgi:hypothetical protein
MVLQQRKQFKLGRLIYRTPYLAFGVNHCVDMTQLTPHNNRRGHKRAGILCLHTFYCGMAGIV